MGKMEKSARKQLFLDYLQKQLGPFSEEPLDYEDQAWHQEEYSLGGYVGLLGPGGLTRYQDILARPVGPVHFAGTETASRWTGYMDGAVRAGLRAADEVSGVL